MALGSLLFFSPPARADELKLKDGTKIVGTIVGYEDNSFKVQTSYGYALVRRDKVASIVVTEPPKELAAEKKPAPAAAQAPAAQNKPAAPPTPAPEPIREEVAKNVYVNHTHGFRMYKPPSWQVIEGARKVLPNAVVVMGTSDETTLLVVGREPLAGTLEAGAAAFERKMRGLFENYRALGDLKPTIAGQPAIQRRFRGVVDEHDWSGVITTVAHGNELFTIIGMTYSDSDLIQIQENVIARTIASLEFINR